MVLIQVAGQIAKLAARSLIKYSGKEAKFWTSRYGKTGGRAVRHGLATGGSIGGLISNSDPLIEDGKISNGYEANKSNQARGGYKWNRSNRYSVKSSTRKYKRCSCARKYKRSRYR